METDTCEICSSPDYAARYQLTDYLLENDQVHTTLVRCLNCGLIYQNPRLSPQEIEEHYPPEYDSFQSEDGDYENLGSRISKFGLSKRRRFVSSLKNGGKLLDVGCATGNFLHKMQSAPGWDLFGIEISEHAANIAHKKYALNVFHGEIEEANYPEDFFDVITLWDVLEHLPDPKSTLNEVHRVLKKNGRLVLRVPNGGSWDAKLFRKYWFGLDAPRHYYVFNQQTIRNLLEMSGFQVTHINCSIGSSIALSMNMRFLMAAKKISEDTRNLVLRIVSHPVIKFIALPFTFIFDQLLLGSFLTLAAEKRS